MAEVVLPELLFGGEIGAEAAGGGLFAGEAAGGGLFAGEAAGGAFAGEAAGLGAETAAGAAAGDFGLGESGLGAIGSEGLQAGSGAAEALGGYGFDAPLATDATAQAGIQSGATDLTGQGGFVSGSGASDVNASAISALNEPTLAEPGVNEFANTTDLSSVASDPAAASATTGEVPPTSPENAPEATEASTSSSGPATTQPYTDPNQTPPTTDPNQPTGDPTRQASARGPGGAGATDNAGAGKFSSNPLSLLQSLGTLMRGQGQSSYLPQGAGYYSALGDFGKGQIAQYQSGALRPEDAATVMIQTKAALNKMRQFYAQSGNSNSTAARQAEGQIMQQSVAMQVQFFNQYLQSGMTALGQAGAGVLNAANIDLQNQRSFTDSLSRALAGASRAFTFSGATGGSNAGNAGNAGSIADAGSSGGSAFEGLEAS